MSARWCPPDPETADACQEARPAARPKLYGLGGECGRSDVLRADALHVEWRMHPADRSAPMRAGSASSSKEAGVGVVNGRRC